VKAPEDLCGGNDEEIVLDILTTDKRRQREVAIRTAARLAFFRSQVDTKLRRSLIQRARVKRSEYAPGEMVCFFRHDKASTKRGRWRGPGLVLGREGPNWWVSYAGRCHLCAEEHMRPSTAEEVGDAFTSRVARADLEKLLFSDPHDPNSYAGNEEEDYEEPGDDENLYRGWDIVVDEDEHMESVEHQQQTTEVPDEELDQVLATPPELQEKQSRSTVYMLKQCFTEHSKEKQLEKEMPWRLIPPEKHSLFKAAEVKQINEHLDHKALTILTKAETDEVYRTVAPERILNSRWAYRDKNYAKRKGDEKIEWKAKARLVIAGHQDPDVTSLTTNAPTVNRLSVMVLLQIASSRRAGPDPWEAAAGDVCAAFLNGKPLQRTLFMKQPRTGVVGMEEGAIFWVEKGIFGLPDSPHSWWVEFQEIIGRVEFTYEGNTYKLGQSPVDPCVFFVQGPEDKEPRAYLAVHVDDLLTIGPK
ncbi:unnamed protein product, partial [Symbiodinium necroappetens]